jgi:hypothetical protein
MNGEIDDEWSMVISSDQWINGKSLIMEVLSWEYHLETVVFPFSVVFLNDD